MKRLAILSFLISPSAFAHQTAFDDPDFLKMGNGDPVVAQELFYFCKATGLTNNGCKSSLDGGGNLKQEAVRTCVRRAISAAPAFNIAGGHEIPGSRAHQLYGTRWHMDYKTDSDGPHRHAYSNFDRERAVAQFRNQLISEKLAEKEALRGSKEFTAGQGFDGSLTIGGSAIVEASTTFGVNSNGSTTRVPAKLSQEEITAIDKKAQLAFDEPSLGGVIPSIVCGLHDKTCTGAGNTQIPNTSYEPDAKKNESKEDKKGAENTPPKHEEESNDSNFHEDTHGNSWAGTGDDDTSPSDGTMTATPLAPDLMPKSPLVSCTEKEFKKLVDSVGSQTKDPNANENESFRKLHAEHMLKNGYCDESFYGKDVCQMYKNKANSVPVIALDEVRKENAAMALRQLKFSGFCDADNLGNEFCKAHKFKLDSTSFDRGLFEVKRGPKLKFDTTGFDAGLTVAPKFKTDKPSRGAPPGFNKEE